MTEEGDRDLSRHWQDAYDARGSRGVSWYESTPRVSLDLIERLGVTSAASVIDVGGGASTLVDELLRRGFGDVTVLDLAGNALAEVARRLPGPPAPRLLHVDFLSWEPERRYDLWHDRALLHFLVDEDDRETYLRALHAATAPGAGVILGTFAPDAPERCSGLPVRRYSAGELVELLGPGFELAESRREEHVTPGGAIQPFTRIAGRLG